MPESANDELSFLEARRRVANAFAPLAQEFVRLSDALGAVLAEPLLAPVDLPLFTNSAMDGYAVRAADVASAGTRLSVTNSIAAGTNPECRLIPETAARIMTGAPLPLFADSVIPFEQTDPSPDGSAVLFKRAAHAGENVRVAGEDVVRGQGLLSPGTRIGPAEIALMSALGIDRIGVHRRPRIAVLATGDEVVAPGARLEPGSIWDANTTMIAAMIQELAATALAAGVARDSSSHLNDRLAEVAGMDVDLLITTGGVSAGDFDVVKEILQQQGTVAFWRVNIKPGRPLAFGTIGAVPIIGLPGNPVAAAVSFLQFARPAILTMMGFPPNQRDLPEIPVTVLDPIDNSAGRRYFVRAIVRVCSTGFEARVVGSQGSANVASFAQANGLIVVPETIVCVHPGMRLSAQMLDWPFHSVQTP